MPRSALLLVCALVPLLHGCSVVNGLFDPSVVVSDHAPSHKVQNGTAYDRATFDVRGVKRIVLPAEATVRRGGSDEQVQLFMAKELQFGGHPGEAMSIGQTRKEMGCASRREGATLTVAIYGEWDSGVEGGAYVKLVAVVPDGIEVEQRPGLSKPLDAVHAWRGLSLPAPGWVAIPDSPDANRSASE
jgi:hypothetical protein